MNSSSLPSAWIHPTINCWVQKNDEYYGGIIEQVFEEKKNAQVTNNITQLTEKVEYHKLYQRDIEELDEGYEDMVDMKYLNLPEILNNLTKRYECNQICTWIGSSLIVINPYQYIPQPQLFDCCNSSLNQAKDGMNKRKKIPHTYSVSEAAFTQMISQKKNQAILISGESGAGKTENSKIAMQYLIWRSSMTDIKPQEQQLLPQIDNINKFNPSQSQQDGSSQHTGTEKQYYRQLVEDLDLFSIEERILACNPILEAFGNAKTLRNNNSSRFGKYVRIYLDRKESKIKGASIQNYLLEKNRVISPANNERNYHIFYHLLRASPELLITLQLNDRCAEDFIYLSKSKCYEVENIPDSKLFLEVKKALKYNRFNEFEQQSIFQILAAILYLGNSSILQKNVNLSNSTEDSFGFAPPQSNRNSASNISSFQKVCELLCVQMEKLEQSLCTKCRKINNSVIISQLSKDQCISLRDSLAKNIYNKLFSWLVHKMNAQLYPATEISQQCMAIGLLDIFGFESFDFNSLEQLCINFTNDQLQGIYIKYTFKQEQQDYISEGIQLDCDLFNYNDNQLLIDLIQSKPTGVLVLLDECSTLQSASDSSFMNSLIKYHSNSSLCSFPKKDKNQFCISHTAKQVIYNVQGFREKNKDEISEEVSQCIATSSNPIIASLFSFDAENKTNKKASKFLGQQFRTQLNELINELESSGVHFVRCIKPNELKKPHDLDMKFVQQQVQYLGLLDNIKIRKFGYPTRIPYSSFLQEYQEIGQKARVMSISEIQKQCNTQLQELIKLDIFQNHEQLSNQISLNQVLFGKNKIFLKDKCISVLNKSMQALIAEKKCKILQIIKAIKHYQFKNNIHSHIQNTRNKLILIQSMIKMWLKRRRYLRLKRGVKLTIKCIRQSLFSSLIRQFRVNVIYHSWKFIFPLLLSKAHIGSAFQSIKSISQYNQQQKTQRKKEQQFKEQQQHCQEQENEKMSTIPSENSALVNKRATTETITKNKVLLSIIDEVNEQNLQQSMNLLNDEQCLEEDLIVQSRASRNIFPRISLGKVPLSANNLADQSSWRKTMLSSIKSNGSTDNNNNYKQNEPSKMIIELTQHHPCSEQIKQQKQFLLQDISLQDVEDSEDINNNLEKSFSEHNLRLIITSNFYSILSHYLQRRTKWGITLSNEQILKHQFKPISHSLTNIQDLQKAVTYEDTKETVSIIRSIAQQLALNYSECTPTQQQFEDANQDFKNKGKQQQNSTSSAAVIRSKSDLQNPRKASNYNSNAGILQQQHLQQQQQMTQNHIMKLFRINKPQSPEEKAINVFKTFLKCAGERKSRFPRRQNVIKLLELINEESIELKEEVYLQLCKQLTCNSSRDSRIKYLKIFAIVSSVLPTTSRFFYYLLNFLYTKMNSTTNSSSKISGSAKLQPQKQGRAASDIISIDEDESNWYKYIILRLYNSQQVQRSCIPTQTELAMIENRKKILVKVYLMNEVCIGIGVESYTNVNEVKQKILNQLGIFSNQNCYALLEQRYYHHTKQQRFINEDERIMDVIAFWEQELQLDCNLVVEHSKSQIVQMNNNNSSPNNINSSIVRKSASMNQIPLQQSKSVNIQKSSDNFKGSSNHSQDELKIYLQIRLQFEFDSGESESISMHYIQNQCEVQEYKYSTSLSLTDYINLAALQLYIDYPIEQIKEYGNNLSFEASYYIPFCIYKQKLPKEWKELIMNSLQQSSFYNKNSTSNKTNNINPIQEAKLSYILYISRQDLFMSKVFKSVKYSRQKQKSLNETLQKDQLQQQQQIPVAAIKDDILLAINPSNLLICDPSGSNRIKRRIPIRNILKFSTSIKQLVIISIDNTKHIFESSIYSQEIGYQVRQYLRRYYSKQN